MKRIHGLLLIFINIENRHQLCDLQQIAHALREVRQFDRTAIVTRGGVQRHKRAQAAAIDVVHTGKIKDQVVLVGDQLSDEITQIGGFLAEDDTPCKIDDQNSIQTSGTDSKLHGSPLFTQQSASRVPWGPTFRKDFSKATFPSELTLAGAGITYNRGLRMSYQVLARKYRPQKFSEVIGQEHVTRTLKNAIEQGRTAHGYIFSGHRGIGKTTIARILAMAFNCRSSDKPVTEPCGVCESCTEIRAGNSVDVIEIDAATNRGIDEIRELREAARYRPARDRFKIYILDEAHQITDAAFNALLKTL